MKSTSVTIRLDKELERMLEKASRQSGKSRSTLAREALARYLRLMQFDAFRKKTMPFAEARGYFFDEDLFRKIS
jgi:predicted transcriptional regulator